MPNKRIRSKQIKSYKRTVKTLEGYEKHLLQRKKVWEDALKVAVGHNQQSEIRRNIYHYRRAHENLRNFYFDI